MTTNFEERRFEDSHDASAPGAVEATRTEFTAEIADKLLNLLSHDDAFRAFFETDPRGALRQLGHETPEAHRGKAGQDPVMSLSYFRDGLASKEKIAAARETMVRAFRERNGGLPFQPFDVCA